MKKWLTGMLMALTGMLMAVFLIFVKERAPAKGGTDDMNYMKLNGVMGERFDANMTNWLLTAPYENPGMIQMYFRRNQPHQKLVPWYGEFTGKYLTSAALCYEMEPNSKLKEAGDYVVEQLARAQDKDGYLGVWPDGQKLAGKNQEGNKTWDVWSHYHNMLGLYLWNQATGNKQAMEIVDKAVGCLYEFFIIRDNNLDEDKDGTDTAIGHICSLLYQTTGDERCLKIVDKVFDTFEDVFGGNYYKDGLEGKPFYQMNRTRWECLHAIETIKEFYTIKGIEDYSTSFENIWDGILRYDVHNTGGFSSGERACGNPYDLRAIETCCTIAWMALSVDMLDLSNDPLVADELELSSWNALLGAQQPSGRSFTYNTPMEGHRLASAHEIVFQAVAGSPELNCCSVNGPRGLGMIGQWGVKTKGEQITVNYYGASETRLTTENNHIVTITQTGSYPFGSDLKISVSSDADYEGEFRLRIPAWSENMAVKRNKEEAEEICAGTYLTLAGVKNGDEIELTFDMSPHFWQGNYEVGGKTSIYAGPILLAYDQRFNEGKESPSMLQLSDLTLSTVMCEDTLYPSPYLLVEATAMNGERVILCDFATAGQAGTYYTTWLPTENELSVLKESDEGNRWCRRISK